MLPECQEKEVLFSIDLLQREEVASLHDTGVWKGTAPVEVNRLRVVRVCYWGFDDILHYDGKLMVLDAVADPVLTIFKDLYDQKFPIAKIRLMDDYQGEDTRSMDDNNTSCFNDRAIVGDSKLSLHAYGLAIDLNPIQNPFVYLPDEAPALAIYSPSSGRSYANRELHRPGKAFRPGMAEQVVDIFYRNGFTVWGGHWDTPIDYQHFQISRDLADALIAMNQEEATLFFKAHVDFAQQKKDLCAAVLNEMAALMLQKRTLVDYYHMEKKIFFNVIHKLSEAT